MELINEQFGEMEVGGADATALEHGYRSKLCVVERRRLGGGVVGGNGRGAPEIFDMPSGERTTKQ